MEMVLVVRSVLLLLISLAISSNFAARVLDESTGSAGLFLDPLLPNPVATTPTTSSSGVGIDSSPPPSTTVDIPSTVILPPPLAPSGSETLIFFMHDILGGSHPTAVAVSGIVNNVEANGQFPFAKTIGGSPLTSLNTAAANIQPLLTGLGGSTSIVTATSTAAASSLPFVAGGQLPIGAAIEKLEFGTITVFDDELTAGQQLGSAVVGKAQGFYVASSQDGSSQVMAFTALLESGEYGDTISFFGVHRTDLSESHLAIVGGTGKYLNAKGFATVQTFQGASHETDGAETVLHFSVFVVY